ncbi:MAG: TolC family protein [Gemmatimonadota bacterium]
MTLRSTIFAATALLALAAPAESQQPRRVTLAEALDLFARNSLELSLGRAQAAEAMALARQAAAFPNPAVATTHEPLSDGTEDYSETYVMLSQRLEWPGARAARRAAASGTADAAVARFVADSSRLAFEVKRAFTEAARAERVERVLERVTSVFREGARSAEVRYAEGDISLYDSRRIRVERAKYETLLAEATLEASAARRRLALLVAPVAEALELSPADSLDGLPPAIAAEHVLEDALARRSDIAAADAALESARAGATAVRRERIPDVTATVGYKTQSDGFGGAFLGLSLPLPLWDRRGGAVAAADARLQAAQSRRSLVRRQVENDMRRALEAYRSLRRRVELLAESRPDEGADLLAIARAAYAEGELELIALFDAAEALLEAQTAEVSLRADLWTAYYDIERAAGGFDGSLDRGDDR